MKEFMVSIIIPSFNKGVFIKETLDSVLNQTYDNWECLIIDDESTDNSNLISLEYVEKDERVKFFKQNTNNGPSSSRNIGINKANGEYILFLDADDLLEKDCLKNRIEFINKHPNYDFWVFKMAEFINKIGDIDKIHNLYPDEESSMGYINLFLKGKNAFSVTAPLWRISALRSINGFNESLRTWEDPELHVRALLNGLKIKVNSESESDCFYRNDRKEKEMKLNNISFLNIWNLNAYLYFIELAKNIKSHNYLGNRNLANNIVQHINLYIIDKRRFKWFIKYLIMLINYRLCKLNECVLLLFWFLIVKFRIKKIGRWSENSLRKRVYYLIKNQ